MMGAPKGNDFAKGNKGGGRHPLYDDAEAMQKKIDEYFDTETVWTIPGLAYHLGFASRQSLLDYEIKEDFSLPVKRAKLRIEAFNAKELHRRDGTVTGIIFTLKNMGWKDQQDLMLEADVNFRELSEGQLDMIATKIFNYGKEK